MLHLSFRAMILKSQLWRPLFEAGDLPWLLALGREWDLVTTPDEQWQGERVGDRIAEAVGDIISLKGRGVAQATKLLHLKRPALVPVIDSNVARALGATLSADGSVETRVAQTCAIVEHFREIGPALRPQLEQVDAHLPSAGIERSLVRILDCLIWCSEEEAWMALVDVLGRWRAAAHPAV